MVQMYTILMSMGPKYNISVVDKSKIVLFAHLSQHIVQGMAITLEGAMGPRHDT